MDVTRKSARKWIDSLSLRVQQGLFAAATYLILLAICLLAISPEQYDLSVGDVAPKTITASKDIVDEITTERRRQAAADAVSPADAPDTVPSCCRHKDRSPEEYKALVNRLSRIEGQVRGVRGMLEKDAYCVDILVQVAAVNSALNSFAKELLAQHMSTCVADDLRAGSDEKLNELIKLLPRLMK